jgi:hypothetical protein
MQNERRWRSLATSHRGGEREEEIKVGLILRLLEVTIK